MALHAQGKVLERNWTFINHYGQHFWEINRVPSQGDDSAMGKSIIKRHPELTDHSSNRAQGFVCRMLSNFFRTKGKPLKKLGEEAHQSDNAGAAGPSGISRNRNQSRRRDPTFPAAVNEENTPPENAELQKLLQELDQISHLGATPRVILLLRETFSHRKEAIHELGTASKVVQKYSQLKQSELILNELTLRVKADVSTILSRLKRCLEELGEFFESPFKGTDKEQAESVLSMYKGLKPKNTSLKAEPILVVEKALTPPNLNSISGDGPRLSLFFSEDGGVASAFILADESVRVKVDRYDFLKTFCTLVGAYHAWNVGYPRGYNNILQLIDEEVFSMSPLKPNVSYHKFKKSLEGISRKKGGSSMM